MLTGLKKCLWFSSPKRKINKHKGMRDAIVMKQLRGQGKNCFTFLKNLVRVWLCRHTKCFGGCFDSTVQSFITLLVHKLSSNCLKLETTAWLALQKSDKFSIVNHQQKQ